MTTESPYNNSQLPLESKDDILTELALVTYYGFNAYSKYDKADICEICFDTLLNHYVLQEPCAKNHAYHRNCLLMYVLCGKKYSCPSCNAIPKKI